jgi:phosphoribosyl-ATP pyrophosphohydrolase/phosphoribosyl-AMP cyclohydrolase/histidinol dehydrogenase
MLIPIVRLESEEPLSQQVKAQFERLTRCNVVILSAHVDKCLPVIKELLSVAQHDVWVQPLQPYTSSDMISVLDEGAASVLATLEAFQTHVSSWEEIPKTRMHVVTDSHAIDNMVALRSEHGLIKIIVKSTICEVLKINTALVSLGKDTRLCFQLEDASASQIADLDGQGHDCVLDSSRLSLDPKGSLGGESVINPTQVLIACLKSDRADGLFSTIVADEHGIALGLVYSSAESLLEANATGKGVYFSRSRNSVWKKGETSGATQDLKRIDVDCDRDALRFTVVQSGPGKSHWL